MNSEDNAKRDRASNPEAKAMRDDTSNPKEEAETDLSKVEQNQQLGIDSMSIRSLGQEACMKPLKPY